MVLKVEGRRINPTFTGEGAKKNEYLNGSSFQRVRPDFKADEDAFISSMEEMEKQLVAALVLWALMHSLINWKKREFLYDLLLFTDVSFLSYLLC